MKKGSSESALEQTGVQKDLDPLGCLAVQFYWLQRH